MIPMLIAVLTITFFLSHAMAINPLQSMMTGWDINIYFDEMERLGLNEPIYVQYAYYLRDFFTGNWGESYSGQFQGWSINDIIITVLPRTLELMIIPIIISPIIAVKLGTTSAKNRKKRKDILIRSVAVVGAGFPSFWIAIMLQFFSGRIIYEATFFEFDIEIYNSNSVTLNPSFPDAIPDTLSILGVLMFFFLLVGGFYLIYRGNKLRKKKQTKIRSSRETLIFLIFGVISFITFFILVYSAFSYMLVYSIITLIVVVIIIAIFIFSAVYKKYKYFILSGTLLCIIGIVPIIMHTNTYGTKFRLLDSIIFNDPIYFWDTLAHLLLPSISMTFLSLAGITRLTRSSMLEVLDQDYIRTARAKGVPEKEIINKHALRNALIPTSNLIIGGVASALLGSLFIELIYGYSGFGFTFFFAIMNGNIPLINGCVMVATIILLSGNLITDVLYTIIDPRIIYT